MTDRWATPCFSVLTFRFLFSHIVNERFYPVTPSGDPTGHRRSALRPLPAGRERGHPPGRPPHSTQASDTDRSAAPGSAATARTGKVSQSPSSSCFLFFFSCGDHGTPCCRTFRRRLSQNPRRRHSWCSGCARIFFIFSPPSVELPRVMPCLTSR